MGGAATCTCLERNLGSKVRVGFMHASIHTCSRLCLGSNAIVGGVGVGCLLEEHVHHPWEGKNLAIVSAARTTWLYELV